VLTQADPLESIAAMRGKTWRKVVDREEVEAHEAKFQVISTRLVAGRRVLHVFAEAQPDESFEAVEPDLEDVYFELLRRDRAQTEAAA
jgi:hypothetical protein